MRNEVGRRSFLTVGLGIAAGAGFGGQAFAQIMDPQTNRWVNVNDGTIRPPGAEIPRRKAKTTRLFKSPPFGTKEDALKNNQRAAFPNGLAIMTDSPGGLWIGEQKLSGAIAGLYAGLPEPEDLTERAWLVDWNGKVLKTVTTPQAKNTGGMAYGDGCLWRATSFAGQEGVYQTDMNSRLVGPVRQIPLGPARGGGGSHGCTWVDGKLWICSNRIHGLVRVDPKTWTADYVINSPAEFDRFHGITYDKGSIWQVAGNSSRSPADSQAHLIRYDVETGDVVEIVDFLPGSADPHALAVHDGVLISCDAGNHPNWKIYESPDSGWIFRIDIV